MIPVHIEVRQMGEDMIIKVQARANETSTPAEEKCVNKIIAGVQQHIVDASGKATFIERPGTTQEERDFPGP